MISEIVSKDAKETKNPSVENYKNIKPEKGMTQKEADDFWDSEFKKESDAAKNESRESTDSKEYLDDNGTKYRDGNHLLPNTKFEVNGYKYETDDKGRLVSAEGKLRMCDPDYERGMENVKKIEGQEYKPGDHQGHLIGHQFGGSDKLENLVPMDAKLNQGDFAKVENTLATAVKDGADVKLRVEPMYENDSTRPSKFKVSYSIDGDRDVEVFKNEREAKI